jgi:hypothetical protein
VGCRGVPRAGRAVERGIGDEERSWWWGETNVTIVVCMGDMGGPQRGAKGGQSWRKGDRQ